MNKTEVASFAKALTGYPFDSNLFNDGEGFPLIRIRNLKESRTDTFYKGDYDETFVVKSGDLLIGMDGEFNLVEWKGAEALLNQRVMKLIVDERKASANYIKYALRKRLKEIEDATPFVTVKHLSHKKVLESQIPLPPLSEQQKIAAILSQVDAAREKRKQANQLTEQFLQSTFLSLFGDPVKNEKGWEKVKISELGKVITGNTPPRADKENYGDFIEWIKTDNISLSAIHPSRATEYLSKKGLQKGRSVEVNSILVTCIAGSPTTIGNVVLTDREVAFNQQINAVAPNEKVNPIFLYSMFKQCKPLIQSSTTLGMKRILTKSKFESIEFILPPLSLQQKFAGIVQQTEQLRSKQRQSEQELEQLFQSLLQRYFG